MANKNTLVAPAELADSYIYVGRRERGQASAFLDSPSWNAGTAAMDLIGGSNLQGLKPSLVTPTSPFRLMSQESASLSAVVDVGGYPGSSTFVVFPVGLGGPNLSILHLELTPSGSTSLIGDPIISPPFILGVAEFTSSVAALTVISASPLKGMVIQSAPLVLDYSPYQVGATTFEGLELSSGSSFEIAATTPNWTPQSGNHVYLFAAFDTSASGVTWQPQISVNAIYARLPAAGGEYEGPSIPVKTR